MLLYSFATFTFNINKILSPVANDCSGSKEKTGLQYNLPQISFLHVRPPESVNAVADISTDNHARV